ncbi:MAG: FMN-binding protein [Anaerovoracaceae bacterium]
MGYGYRGETRISVTLKSDEITDIKTLNTGDDGEYYNPAFSNISQSIISNQDTKVDTVSGATYSSNGIIDAVKDALKQAKN